MSKIFPDDYGRRWRSGFCARLCLRLQEWGESSGSIWYVQRIFPRVRWVANISKSRLMSRQMSRPIPYVLQEQGLSNQYFQECGELPSSIYFRSTTLSLLCSIGSSLPNQIFSSPTLSSSALHCSGWISPAQVRDGLHIMAGCSVNLADQPEVKLILTDV